MSDTNLDRFLTEAVSHGVLSRDEADDCRRILAVLAEVGVELTVDQVAVRKGYATEDDVARIRRLLANRRVGKYEILERLGEGGGGIVWRARDTVLDRVVALKVLSRRAEGTDLYRERFLREARVAVTLNHTHIVRGLDFGESDGYRWFAMEFVAGESLAERLHRVGRLAEADAFQIATEVVHALEYVRQFDLVHRDIKPENLLITPRGQVKVCDLGLARPTLDEAERLGGGMTAGTPLYMAPEQIRRPDAADWRADVYGLGATLYHALTGRPPFQNDAAGSVIHKHLETPPRNPRELVLELSQGAAAVVMKMLEKELSARYACLEDLRADLESVVEGRPPVHTLSLVPASAAVRPVAARPGVVRRERRLGARIAVGVVVTALVAGAGWGGWKLWERPAPSVPPPSSPRRPLDRTAARPLPRETAPAAPAPGPAATTVPPASEALAREALAIADRRLADAPEGLDGLPQVNSAAEQYAFVLERHPATAAARAAERALVTVRERREKLAEDLLSTRMVDARQAETEGRLRDAWALFEEFPLGLHGTRGADDAAAAAEVLRARCRDRVSTRLAECDTAISSRRFPDAEAALRSAAAALLPGETAEFDAVVDRLAVEREAHFRLVDAMRPAYEQWVGEVLRLAGSEGLAAATERARSAGFEPFAEQTAVLVEDLLLLDAHRGQPGAREGADRPKEFLDGFDRIVRGEPWAARDLAALLGPDRAEASRLREYASLTERLIEADIVALVEQAQSTRSRTERRRLLEAAERSWPAHPLPHLHLAYLYLDQRNERSARAELELARRLPAARIALARLLEQAGDVERALEELDDGLAALGPDDPERQGLADCRVEIEERHHADRLHSLHLKLARARVSDLEQVAREILEIEPLDERALVGLGLHLERTAVEGDWETLFEAWNLLTRYMKVRDPTRVGNRREAADALERLETFRRRSQAADGRLLDSHRLLSEGRAQVAVDSFLDVLRVAPLDPESHLGLGHAHLALAKARGALGRHPEEARAAFDRAAALDPENVEARTGRGRARLLLGDASGALEDARWVLERDRRHAEPALVAGEAEMALGHAAQALGHLEDAYLREPSVRARLLQARAHLRTGRASAARSILTNDLEGRPIPPEDQADYDDLLLQLGL